MRIIFLDIDGVLCTWESMKLPRIPPLPSHARFCQRSVANLNRITDVTRAVIVISSSWRCQSAPQSLSLGSHIAREGVSARIIGQTPRLRTCRGYEIQAWLDDACYRDPIESLVILDDDSDMEHLNNRLVHVTNGMDTGLLDHHVEATIKLLRTPL